MSARSMILDEHPDLTDLLRNVSEDREKLAQADWGPFRWRHIGYWKEPEWEHLPDPRDFVDEEWDQEERRAVIEYLRGGRVLHCWLGYAQCRFGCSGNFGDTCLTDGEWVWPEGFVHYVEVHGVKPPLAFIEKVLRIARRERS